MRKFILHWLAYSIVGLFYALGISGVLVGKLMYAVIKAVLSALMR